MAVSLVPKWDKKQIKKYLDERKRRIDAAIMLNLQRVGEEFVKNSRDNNTYKDRTGNLRSSIGYVIIRNGRQIEQNFETKKGPNGNGKDGQRNAKKIVRQAVKKYPKGFVLIGVAGMNYAAAVEARGFDVISLGSIQAETDLKAAMKRLKEKIK